MSWRLCRVSACTRVFFGSSNGNREHRKGDVTLVLGTKTTRKKSITSNIFVGLSALCCTGHQSIKRKGVKSSNIKFHKAKVGTEFSLTHPR
jgi:hypothetical protein